MELLDRDHNKNTRFCLLKRTSRALHERLKKWKRLKGWGVGGWSVAADPEAGSYLLPATGFAFALHKGRSTMESQFFSAPKLGAVSQSDEEAVREIIFDTDSLGFLDDGEQLDPSKPSRGAATWRRLTQLLAHDR